MPVPIRTNITYMHKLILGHHLLVGGICKLVELAASDDMY